MKIISKRPVLSLAITLMIIVFTTLVFNSCAKKADDPAVVPTPATAPFSFTPSGGSIGTLVTLAGTDFSTAQSVSIGGVSAIIISQSSSVLTALVMPGTSVGTISVTTPSEVLTSTSTFTINASGVPSSQQGSKLVGTGATGAAYQGFKVSVSADGNTALVGGNIDNSGVGATWAFTRSAGVWMQQGAKLIGTGAVGAANQGISVSVSADGNTALVGGNSDNSNTGAVWVFTRSAGVWTQQGAKLVGTGATGAARQGASVSISADGNTALVGGYADNSNAGAVWIFTRSAGVWTQQGSKLIGTGAVGAAFQGISVSVSADGNTALVGGSQDNSTTGAVWLFVRTAGVWTQQGTKLVGTGATGAAKQGISVSISADGNTALVGGNFDNLDTGAAWVFARAAGVWTQQGTKFVGTGFTGTSNQGASVSISADGNTALIGGFNDNSGVGATWIFTRSAGVWTQQGTKLVGTGATGTAYQGFVSISADGNTAFVGGYTDNSLLGAAWVFTP